MSVSFVALGCTHVPLQDGAAVDWAIEQVARLRPDVLVHLGDLIESNASSRWDDAREATWTLQQEFDAASALLRSLRRAAPRARRVFLPGNHEDNLRRAGRLDERIRELCDWRRGIRELSEGDWHIGAIYNLCRTRGCWRLGQVCFAHGYETSAGPIKRESFYFADPWGIFIHAHTHRPTPVQEVEWADLPLRVWEVNAGCLRDLDAGYMERRRKWRWGQGLVVGRCDPVKSPRARRHWDAELLLYRRYDDWQATC